MRTRRSFLSLAAALGGALGISGCGDAGPGRTQFSVRYRITLEVETPEGVKTGSSVIENVWISDKLGIPRSSVYAKDKGEATAVDLGPRGVLFALLAKRSSNGSVGSSGDYAHDLPLNAFDHAGMIARGRLPMPGDLVGLQTGVKIDLKKEDIPFLARFRDLNDPKSVEAVDPNDLAKSFGSGVKLLRATIEMTNEPVTTGIEKRLGWVTDRNVMQNPGWSSLPYLSRVVINGLFTGTPEEHFK